MKYDEIVDKVSETLVVAGSSFREDKIKAYEKVILSQSG